MNVNTKKIKVAMTNKEITLFELSKEVDISYSHLSNVINGHTNTSRRTLKLIALALNVNIDDICTFEEEAKQNEQNA
ncbi:helix-turn-helix transcriptional regulator [Mammaliicoccus sciuri]|uniref:helix-turn-helix domain-containing protein n=1 Tax=Mammaliicoccus sciuri TaxID=1296 RepID=UPI002DBA5D79|nr:helix-turn-helix transcriptional regulator [Mammaliicoccus sciuri]MEB6215897.1 helix-turn-helix transcriptional regulator [Mammaliicoccus sciuri]MEB6331011.1 helix-turn-helix transcriptional regulator [Mammaliicoccus sciuri]